MNLLLISIDSLRLDHSPLLSGAVTTPGFAAQVQAFHRYSRCFSVASATRPVHASLFSGLYPTQHGVLSQRSPAVRPGTPDLLAVLEAQNWRVRGYSEAPAIFTGLPLASYVQELDPRPERGIAQLDRYVRMPGCDRLALFVHYWSTHTPYGAADGRAFGETGRLLAAGRIDQVKERYRAAVIELFERKLAPLLAALDRDRWTILIWSDHGDSWTREEPYHGLTLRNSVLRVPLYMHVPDVFLAPADSLVSLVDIAPTLADRFDLAMDGPLAGTSLLQQPPPRYCAAQIHPLTGPDLGMQNRDSGTCTPPRELLWSVFDLSRKLTVDQRTGRSVLEDTLTEQPVAEPGTREQLLAVYRELVGESHSANRDGPDSDPLLDQRLRDLGYLD